VIIDRPTLVRLKKLGALGAIVMVHHARSQMYLAGAQLTSEGNSVQERDTNSTTASADASQVGGYLRIA